MALSIGDTVYETRKTQGITQDQMALALGVSRVSVWNWENGKASPSVAALQSWQYSDNKWVAQLAASILDTMFPGRTTKD